MCLTAKMAQMSKTVLATTMALDMRYSKDIFKDFQRLSLKFEFMNLCNIGLFIFSLERFSNVENVTLVSVRMDRRPRANTVPLNPVMG